MTEPETADGPDVVFVDVLTDEELSVIARPGPMPVMPFLDDLPEEQRETARRSAYRSLVARGVVDPPTPEAIAAATALRDGSVDLMVRQDLRSVIALREAAEVVVAAARTTATTQDFWYAHLVDDVVLLEEVSRDGLHRFALAGADALEELVVGAVLHAESGDGAGPPLSVTAESGDPTPPDEVLEQLGAAFFRADVVVRRPGDTDPPAFAVFSGPGGCWWLDGLQTPVVAEPLLAEVARRQVADAVSAVRAEAVVLGGG